MQLLITRALFAAIVLMFGSTACVTPEVTNAPEGPSKQVDFTRFKTVKYSVHPIEKTEYGDDEEYGKSTLELFDLLLGKKLASMGYEVVPNAPADLTIDVAVSAVKPGSAAARFLVGFGAGRAVLRFDASFSDSSGVLASFAGGRSHTGMEFGESFADKDQIKTLAVTTAVDQVELFMKNGGRFPGKSK